MEDARRGISLTHANMKAGKLLNVHDSQPQHPDFPTVFILPPPAPRRKRLPRPTGPPEAALGPKPGEGERGVPEGGAGPEGDPGGGRRSQSTGGVHSVRVPGRLMSGASGCPKNLTSKMPRKVVL